jgi:hypothetical protein
MKHVPNIPQRPPPGLIEAIEAEGIGIKNGDHDLWYATDEKRAAEIAETFDPTAHVKAEKAAELAEARWRKETGGFMFQPVKADRPYRFISTREAMGPVMGAVLALQSGVFPSPTLWKTAEGIFVEITEADVVPLFKAFAAHVAAAFTEEATKRDAADKAPWEEVGDIKIEAVAAIKVGE